MKTDPSTPAEWQEVVNIAETCLLIDSCRQYGLITGGPVINVDRCRELLTRGKARGVCPTDDGVDTYLRAFITGASA